MDEQITVSVETWQRMVDQKRLLDCLMIVGVERWPGYRAALEMMEAAESQRPSMALARVANALLQQREASS